MAKLVGPLFSLEARNKLGDALVYFPWKGRNVARAWTKPTNPQDVDQKIIRQKLASAGKNTKYVNLPATGLLDGSSLYQQLKADAPATIPWNAHYVGTIMNRQKTDLNFTGDSAALFGLGATQLTAWSNVSVDLGFTDLTGAQYATEISPELQLYIGAVAGWELLLSGDFIDMSVAPSTWAVADISNFGSEYQTVV